MVEIRTRPDGTKYPITPKKGGGGIAVAGVAALAIAGGGGAIGLGGGAVGGAGTTAESLAGNMVGDVADSLPGRNVGTRRAEGRKSAQRGKSDEAWSRMKLKELKRIPKRELECLAAATDRVRDFLLRTPCTSLDRVLLAVGDGHGNAAVVSVVRVEFRTTTQAKAFERVESVQGSGDIKPLASSLLGLANVKFTGHHYHSRPDKTARVVAETETATGHIDADTLDAAAEIAAYLPVR
ncbi:hypothetical protein GCM10023192_28610 [Amycolatopsis samaneae]